MRIDNRKFRRRPLHYPAKLDLHDGSPPRECLFWDISEAGAKITVQDPADLPEYVTIVLSDAGHAERRCRIVWRSELDVGVKFVADASKTTSENPNAGAVSEEQQAS